MAQQGNKKLWGGGFEQQADPQLDDFWGSIKFDCRLAVQDITGSIAHAKMLGHTGIITAEESRQLVDGLNALLAEAKVGTLTYSPQDEDIHMNVERLLHERIGAVAGKLHTGRSRNDQVALDMHLFVREQTHKTIALLNELALVLITQAEQNQTTIMPGYTHLQRAQPVSFAHHLLAYVWMFFRDRDRYINSLDRLAFSPLGAGAIAGTPMPIDRQFTAKELGFADVYPNSMDAVGNRDFMVEIMMCNTFVAMHLSRLCEEIVLWISSEFSFVKLSDAYCTGSSMMPQKKNADLAELVRGKTGRVYGDLFSLLTVMKGLPMTYNKDFQEDKECVFDSCDTVQQSLFHITGMLRTMQAKPANMLQATKDGFLNATDVADYLVVKGLPLRQAHEVSAKLVQHALAQNCTLEDLSLDTLKSFNPLFEPDVFEAMRIETVVARRVSEGGTAPSEVAEQLEKAKACAR